MRRHNPNWGRTAVIAGWLALVSAGFFALESYANRPAPASGAPLTWPADAVLERSTAHHALLVFIHPRCGCTVATMRELERLVAEAPAPLDVHLIYDAPEGTTSAWVQRTTWEIGGRIPGATRHVDHASLVARLFGAHASGTVLCYDPDGALRFTGGLTSRRAHEGFSAGRGIIGDLLRGRDVPQNSTPIYGCPLARPSAELAP